MSSSTLEKVVTKDPDIIYQELASMQVELDSDPIAYGPKRLNSKVAEVRAHLSRCERVSLQVSQDLHLVKREHRRLEADFKLQFQELLAGDPEVRAGRNVADREAIANMRLRTEIEEISSLQFAIQDLEAVMTVVKAKRADLKDIQGRLKDQLKICQEEINLGARWGSRGTGKVKELERNQGVANAADIDAIHQMLDTVEGEIHLAVSPSAPAPTVASTPVPVEVRQVEKPKPTLETQGLGMSKFHGSSTDSDVDSILSSLDLDTNLNNSYTKKAESAPSNVINLDDFLDTLSA